MAKKQPHPVTQNDRDAFALFVQKWQEALNLNDWRIVPSSKRAAKANMAEVCGMDLKARLATYRIGDDFGATPVTGHSLEETACHELMHVRLFELIQLARDPQSSDDAIASAEHAVIIAIVRLLVPPAELESQ